MLRSFFRYAVKPSRSFTYSLFRPFSSEDSEFDERHLEYIRALKQMSYSELVVEMKKYSGKPVSRTKVGVLNFILSHLMKKIDVKTQTQKLTINLEKDVAFQENLADIYKQLEIEGDEYETEFSFQVNSNRYESAFRSSMFKNNIHEIFSYNKKNRNSLPFIESYSPQQIIHEINRLTCSQVRNESLTMFARSELFRNKKYEGKLRIGLKKDIKDFYSKLVLLEGEYQFVTIDRLSQLMQEIKNLDIHSHTLHQVTKAMADPLSQMDCIAFFKWAPISLVNLTWQAFVSFLEIYARNDLVYLLNCLHNFKVHLKYSPSDESVIYEKVSEKIVETLKVDPQNFNIKDLANILTNYRLLKIPITPIMKNNLDIITNKFFLSFSSIASRELDPENEGKRESSSPQEILNLLYGLTFCLEAGHKINLLLNLVFKKFLNAGFGQFDKLYVMKILTLALSYNMKINDDMVYAVQENKKIFENLNINEIFILVESLKESKHDLVYIYQTLNQAFLSCVENFSVITDFNLIMMITKIHVFFLKKKFFELRKVTIEKKNLVLISKLENSLESFPDLTNRIDDLVYISSLYSPFFNVPDFLFRKIIQNEAAITITPNKKSLYLNFIQDLLKRFEPKYTYINIFNLNDVECADKISGDTIELFEVFLKKIQNSSYLSFNLISMHILIFEEFRKGCFPKRVDLKNYVNELCPKVISCFKKLENMPTDCCFLISRFFQKNVGLIEQSSREAIVKEILVFLDNYKFDNDANELLPLIWNTLNALETFESKKNEYTEEFTRFLRNKLLPLLNDNLRIDDAIVYDNNIIQTFSKQVKTASTDNFEYLLPILEKLNLLKSSPLESYLALIKKIIRSWEGKILVENLILLSDLQLKCPDIFRLAIPALSTLLNFYLSVQKAALNDIYDEKTVLKLLKSFIFQEESAPNFKWEKGETIFLSVLMNFVWSSLSVSEITVLFKIIGSHQSNYYYGIIEKFNSLVFKEDNAESIISFKTNLPGFIRIPSLEEKFLAILQDNLSKNTGSLIEICTKDKIWNDSLFLNAYNYSIENPSKELFCNLLKYLFESGVELGDYDLIFSIINRVKFEEFSIENLEIILLLLLSAKIRNFDTFKYSFMQDVYPTFFKSQRKKTTEALILIIIEKVLKTPFYSYELNLNVGDKMVGLKFDKSFKLMSGRFKPRETFKMLTFNDGTLNGVNFDSENMIKAGDLVSRNGSLDPSQYFDEIHLPILRYFLYNEYSVKTNLPFEKESLSEEFKKALAKELKTWKNKDDYANFLIEFSITLNSLNYTYTTNFECPETYIQIDLAIQDESGKRGFIFVDENQTIKVLKDNKEILTPDNASIIKAYTLESLGGWKIRLVMFSEWIKEHNSKKKREQYLEKILGNVGQIGAQK